MCTAFMEDTSPTKLSLGARLGLAFRILSDAAFARRAADVRQPAKPKTDESGLAVLSLLQREGRLVDFLQEDVAPFSDAEVGAAARVVHDGCKKVLKEHFTLEPVLTEAEGAAITLPAGFDARRIRITGNVGGTPPFRGALKHHGWVATAVRMPSVSETLDPRVIMAAEVEL